MSMLDWAKREVELACKRENPEWDGESFDYGCACYKSALKAYEALYEDGHSGLSWNITANIFTRLAKSLPLTPITEDDFVQYQPIPEYEQGLLKLRGLKSNIQCNRMSSLFRKEYIDGRVEYKDTDRTVLNDYWVNDLANNIVNELYPIKIPYNPPVRKFHVYADEYKTSTCKDDYDLIYFKYLITPKGERIELDKIYREDVGFITKEEFDSLEKEKV